MTLWFATEGFTDDQRQVLARHFTDLDGPVFALVDLPEVVKGALFARYSRTTKSLRRLFLDEFAEDVDESGQMTSVGVDRAEKLYDRVFLEYGDDSVAQLGGVHLACEQASQLLAKALEWGRLAAYLEQSTRYMRYDDMPGGRWRATVPPELQDTGLETRYREYLDEVFRLYGEMFEPMYAWYERRFPQEANDSDFVYRSTITAEDVRHAACVSARCDPVERRHLRDRAVLRAAADAIVRAPAGGDARVRRPDAGGAAEGDPRVPEAGGRGGPRRRVGAVLAGDAGRRRGAGGEARRRRDARAAGRGHPRRLRPRGRGEGRGRGPVRQHRSAR